ncbi:putative transcription factor interactor and regulator CCHC(Zn) family [Arabidopsis thaliana]
MPWLFNNWFVVNQRWKIFPSIDFLTIIELWVQIRGIPMLYVCVETVSEIAQELGHIIHIDFHEATTNQIAYIQVRVKYERSRRICSHCLRFTHQRNHCPYSLPLPALRHEDIVQISAERVKRALHDELCRSDMNSQSQLSDDLFSAPITTSTAASTTPTFHDLHHKPKGKCNILTI